MRPRTLVLPVLLLALAVLCRVGLAEPEKPAWPKEVKNGIGMRLVRIPAGEFMMGADKEDDADAQHREKPRHKVKISKKYWLGIHEVTQKQFREVMGYNPSHFSKDGRKRDADSKYLDLPGGGKVGEDTNDYPVENVSSEEAREFCVKLSKMAEEKKNGRLYRLPTEAEWEYACRGGAGEYKRFNVGDTLTRDDANFGESKLNRTCKVGSYKPNAFGLHDTHGNVWEWCADWYVEMYYADSPAADPKGPEKGASRVFRGGSWCNRARSCRSADRGGLDAPDRDSRLGFRVALVPMR